MLAQTKTDGHKASDIPKLRSRARSRVYTEGIIAGLIGAATIAAWFLILDAIQGRPLFTPTLLGTALSLGGTGLPDPETLKISFETVIWFTWIHSLVFVLIGMFMAWLLKVAKRNPDAGIGILILFILMGFVFIGLTMVFAEQVLHNLTLPAVLVGNLLAAAAMGAYFWSWHRKLRMRP